MNMGEVVVGLLSPVLQNIVVLGVLALNNPTQLRCSTARRLKDIIVSCVSDLATRGFCLSCKARINAIPLLYSF
jgi:hypothetical protein